MACLVRPRAPGGRLLGSGTRYEGGQGEVSGAPPPPPELTTKAFCHPPPPPQIAPPGAPNQPTLPTPPPHRPPPPQGPSAHFYWGGGVAYKSEETAPPWPRGAPVVLRSRPPPPHAQASAADEVGPDVSQRAEVRDGSGLRRPGQPVPGACGALTCEGGPGMDAAGHTGSAAVNETPGPSARGRARRSLPGLRVRGPAVNETPASGRSPRDRAHGGAHGGRCRGCASEGRAPKAVRCAGAGGGACRRTDGRPGRAVWEAGHWSALRSISGAMRAWGWDARRGTRAMAGSSGCSGPWGFEPGTSASDVGCMTAQLRDLFRGGL